MLFTIKIIRKFFGIAFKLVKLPIKLVSMFAGSQATSVDSIAGGSTETTSTETVSSKTGEGTLSGFSSDNSPQQAQKYLNWLQYGLFAWGALQAILFIGIFASFGATSFRSTSGILPLIGVIGGIFALLPIIILTFETQIDQEHDFCHTAFY